MTELAASSLERLEFEADVLMSLVNGVVILSQDFMDFI